MLSTEHLGIEESIAFCGDGLRIGLSSDLDALVVDERYMFRYERVIKRVQVERREGHRDVRGGERGRHLGRRRQQRAGRLQESLCLPMFGHSLPVSAFAPTGPRVSHPLAASIGPSAVGICHPSLPGFPRIMCAPNFLTCTRGVLVLRQEIIQNLIQGERPRYSLPTAHGYAHKWFCL